MTVRQLLNSLDSRELSEWQAFFPVYNEQMKDYQKKEDVSMQDKMKFEMKGYGKGKR